MAFQKKVTKPLFAMVPQIKQCQVAKQTICIMPLKVNLSNFKQKKMSNRWATHGCVTMHCLELLDES
jgi:hypothetical protein